MPEKTFSKFPEYRILRHKHNKKWYGLVMNVPKNKLNNEGKGETDIIDIKVVPELIGSLLEKKGYYSAYHMNKENWISIDLKSCVSLQEVKKMIDISYELTK
ncbi:hypothetical protein A5819_000054 [Enterococcus sp. 7E2_DIV0204]|nr:MULTISPECIES: MmcQ/YjbR family DNA-binding protein [unclassified Enterococcus]OTN87608.1 hypothetical protein A5819_000054 [Enterococcus sp. 7E2_DIV0204]OTP49710.1 hypothetical protein A5884_002910 [Enterococcus sp. 7D2_DIV0200]